MSTASRLRTAFGQQRAAIPAFKLRFETVSQASLSSVNGLHFTVSIFSHLSLEALSRKASVNSPLSQWICLGFAFDRSSVSPNLAAKTAGCLIHQAARPKASHPGNAPLRRSPKCLIGLIVTRFSCLPFTSSPLVEPKWSTRIGWDTLFFNYNFNHKRVIVYFHSMVASKSY